MDTRRLAAFLGDDYEQVIRHTCEEALADSFIALPSPVSAPASIAS